MRKISRSWRLRRERVAVIRTHSCTQCAVTWRAPAGRRNWTGRKKHPECWCCGKRRTVIPFSNGSPGLNAYTARPGRTVEAAL